MTTVFVWVLILTSGNGHYGYATQMGNYADKESCLRVKNSVPIKDAFSIDSQCIEIKVYK